MLDHGKEADRYDASRGGEPRADAAAAAVRGLLPPDARTLLDVACGTGLVTRSLAGTGLRVTGVDSAHNMARMASGRLPDAVVVGDSRQLPFPDGSFDAVCTVWLLHLLSGADEAAAVVAECARVLRPGGVFVTTVDKAAGHDVGSDIDAVLAQRPVSPTVDRARTIEAYAAAQGLVPAGEARFRATARVEPPAPRSRTSAVAGSPASRPTAPWPLSSWRASRPCRTRKCRVRTRCSRSAVDGCEFLPPARRIEEIGPSVVRDVPVAEEEVEIVRAAHERWSPVVPSGRMSAM